MRTTHTCLVLLAVLAAVDLAGCKEARKKPAAGTSAGGEGQADREGRAAPDRHVGPSAGPMRPSRRGPMTAPEVRPPDEDPGSAGEPGGGDGDGDGDGDERADRPARKTRAERVAEFDADGDGKLTGEERDVMRKTRIGDQLERLDQDGDGKLTATEVDASKRFRTLDFVAADVDRDGFLSTEELDGAMTQRRQQRRTDRRPIRFRDGNPGGDAGVR